MNYSHLVEPVEPSGQGILQGLVRTTGQKCTRPWMRLKKYNIYDVKDNISMGRGQTDSCKIKVNKREPVSRNAILIEEFTGDRCGNCPSGSAAIHKTMKELEEQSKAFIVYHHVGFTEDKFTIAASRPLKFLRSKKRAVKRRFMVKLLWIVRGN